MEHLTKPESKRQACDVPSAHVPAADKAKWWSSILKFKHVSTAFLLIVVSLLKYPKIKGDPPT